MHQVTCTAPVNIAVIKYWGKTNLELILPTNSSLSVTLSQDDLCSTTSIVAGPQVTADCMWLNGIQEPFTKRIANVIAKARKLRAEMELLDSRLERLSTYNICVNSKNNFPTAAGLASSASGFACLTFALAKLFHLNVQMEKLSGLARLGSGSACRSMFGGFVEWDMGTNDQDSLARQVAPQSHWPEMEAIVLVVSNVKKHTSSTAGMQQTAATSPLFKQRLEIVPERIIRMKRAILDKDFDAFAELTMQDSNQFHANDVSRQIVRVVTEYNSLFLRAEGGRNIGYKCAYTFDAGPNAVLYLPRDNVPEILALVDHFFPASNASKEYYGRALEFSNGEIDQRIKSVGLVPQRDSLSRIISTKIGPGPICIAEGWNERSLFDVSGVPLFK